MSVASGERHGEQKHQHGRAHARKEVEAARVAGGGVRAGDTEPFGGQQVVYGESETIAPRTMEPR